MMRALYEGVIMGCIVAFVVLGLHHFWKLIFH